MKKRGTLKKVCNESVKRYYELYNKEVAEFFQIGQNTDYEIRGSRVHWDSKIRYFERLDDNGENKNSNFKLLGSYWTGIEKRIFFKMIERFSIHRIDEWRYMIPHKSLFEILNYYKVLQKNLFFLKKRKFKGLIKLKDIPISYEMNDKIIELEDYMGERVTNFSLRKIKKNYHSKPVSNDNELIDLNNWSKRWELMYRKSNIEEIQPINKDVKPFSKDSLNYIEKLIKTRLRKLLWYTVLPELDTKTINKNELLLTNNNDNNNDNNDNTAINIRTTTQKHFYPTVITQNHVNKAITIMKHESHDCHTLAESVVRTINKFHIDFKPRDGNIFKRKDVRNGIIPELVHVTIAQSSTQLSPRVGHIVADEDEQEQDVVVESDEDDDSETDARDLAISRVQSDALLAYVLRDIG